MTHDHDDATLASAAADLDRGAARLDKQADELESLKETSRDSTFLDELAAALGVPVDSLDSFKHLFDAERRAEYVRELRESAAETRAVADRTRERLRKLWELREGEEAPDA